MNAQLAFAVRTAMLGVFATVKDTWHPSKKPTEMRASVHISRVYVTVLIEIIAFEQILTAPRGRL